MSNLNTIIMACQTLASEGKRPSVGLLKARLPNKTPLPQIIAGLNAYKQHPTQRVDVPENVNQAQPLDVESRIEHLETSVKRLEAQVAKLIDSQTNQNT